MQANVKAREGPVASKLKLQPGAQNSAGSGDFVLSVSDNIITRGCRDLQNEPSPL